MRKALQELTNEHRVIEKVLGSLETFAAAAGAGKPVERETVAQYTEFFREFADRCHHGKEEDRLLVRMVQHGLPSQGGPGARVLDEHKAGRAYVRELAAIGDGRGPLSPADRERLDSVVRGYVELLTHHIRKEDGLLFPMAAQLIPAAELDAMAGEFETFEREIMGAGAHERLHALAESLLEAYPPPPDAGPPQPGRPREEPPAVPCPAVRMPHESGLRPAQNARWSIPG